MKKRKTFFWIIILVVIAAVLAVVFVSLFSTPSTKNLAISLNDKVTTGYLSDKNKSEKDICEYNDIEEYLVNIETVLANEESKNEARNIRIAYQAFRVQGEFFNRQIVFSSFSEKFKENKPKIEKLLNEAQKCADDAENYIEKNRTLTSGSDYWTAQTWAGVRDNLVEMTTKTVEMFKLMSEVYSASVGSKIMNNDLTDIIFRYSNETSANMAENLAKDNSLGEKLLKFVNRYLTIENEVKILEFCYDYDAPSKIASIIEGWGSDQLFKNFVGGVV